MEDTTGFLKASTGDIETVSGSDFTTVIVNNKSNADMTGIFAKIYTRNFRVMDYL
jgi:hypothetical protein